MVIVLVASVVVLAVAILVLRSGTRKVVPDPMPDEPPAPEDARRREERAEAVAREWRDRLSREPFGEDLAGAVWDRLVAMPREEGVIVERHPYYCGHGLIRMPEGVILCEIEDARYPGSPAIATWTDRDAFVGFFARQSDFSCGGWDEAEPLFFTTDPQKRDNQRLTRAVLERFLRGGG